MKWITTRKAMQLLKLTNTGLRHVIARGDLVSRKVPKPIRLCIEVSNESVVAYKKLRKTGERRICHSQSAVHFRSNLKNKGYILIYKPEHPRAMYDGYVYQQWLVMEEYLGRFLTKQETVHHINRIRDDNRLENLKLYSSRSEHMKMAHSAAMTEAMKNLGRVKN